MTVSFDRNDEESIAFEHDRCESKVDTNSVVTR